MPELKLNHRVAFDQAHELIFCLANLSLHVGGERLQKQIMAKRATRDIDDEQEQLIEDNILDEIKSNQLKPDIIFKKLISS